MAFLPATTARAEISDFSVLDPAAQTNGALPYLMPVMPTTLRPSIL
jgi:hypothetical protein